MLVEYLMEVFDGGGFVENCVVYDFFNIWCLMIVGGIE